MSLRAISISLVIYSAKLVTGQVTPWQWGSLAPYADNPEDYFGVKNVGLPDGCQIDQVHLLQRHAQRFPEQKDDDSTLLEAFRDTVGNSTGKFSGSLEFLSRWRYNHGEELLIGQGAETEFASGVSFWKQYGRILYDNYTPGQLQFNVSANKPAPFQRTTDKPRVQNSQLSWALGFFGPSFYDPPDVNLTSFVGRYPALVMSEDIGTPLAAHKVCKGCKSAKPWGGKLADDFITEALAGTTAALQGSAPWKLRSFNDTYAMQLMCVYDVALMGDSEFCKLFSASDWDAFAHRFNIEHYYASSFGNPTGRAQGIGYVEEMLARLNEHLIEKSETSVNVNLDNNSQTFPVAGQKFFADFSHDHVIIAVLTALSLENFKTPPDLKKPSNAASFNVSAMTPFGARLVTERIVCTSDSPNEVETHRTFYTSKPCGNEKDLPMTQKFVRMRLNNGILPLNKINKGSCGRTDGMCRLEDFTKSGNEAISLSNYATVCTSKDYRNLKPDTPIDWYDWDGGANIPTKMPPPPPIQTKQIVLEL